MPGEHSIPAWERRFNRAAAEPELRIFRRLSEGILEQKMLGRESARANAIRVIRSLIQRILLFANMDVLGPALPDSHLGRLHAETGDFGQER
jgi:hypothetical protein